jgi:hypothetical protein
MGNEAYNSDRSTFEFPAGRRVVVREACSYTRMFYCRYSLHEIVVIS